MAKTALVTGGARRLGAAICKALHAAGFDVIVHYQQSDKEARRLVTNLNHARADSAICLSANLAQPAAVRLFAAEAQAWRNRLDLLVNNASCFHATPLANTSDHDWDALINTNLRAPFLLCQQLAVALTKQQGSIINLVDIYAEKPLLNHAVYSISKAGLAMLTLSLARELAPNVRVNGIAPGLILAPVNDPERAQTLLDSVPLGRSGEANDIASTAVWLATAAPYITGQIIQVDGGRSLSFPGG